MDDYYIDKYEVTSAPFKEFVEATGYVTNAERKGYGEVWNPKENSAKPWRQFKGYQVLSADRAYQSPDYSSNFVGDFVVLGVHRI